MAEPRRLRFVVIVDDEGGDNDYDQIIEGLTSVGEIESETVIS